MRGPRSVAVRRARWLVPVAAAAALAGILLMNPTPEGPAGGSAADRVVPEIPARPPAVAVEAPEGRDVLVFETDDPTVTVVWFF